MEQAEAVNFNRKLYRFARKNMSRSLQTLALRLPGDFCGYYLFTLQKGSREDAVTLSSR